MYQADKMISQTARQTPGSVVVRALDLRLRMSRFDSRPFRFQVTTLGKLFTHVCLCNQAV